MSSEKRQDNAELRVLAKKLLSQLENGKVDFTRFEIKVIVHSEKVLNNTNFFIPRCIKHEKTIERENEVIDITQNIQIIYT